MINYLTIEKVLKYINDFGKGNKNYYRIWSFYLNIYIYPYVCIPAVAH